MCACPCAQVFFLQEILKHNTILVYTVDHVATVNQLAKYMLLGASTFSHILNFCEEINAIAFTLNFSIKIVPHFC